MAQELFVVAPDDEGEEDYPGVSFPGTEGHAEGQDIGQPRRTRHRSSIGFPYNDLRDAESVAIEVHKQGGFSGCGLDQLAHGLHHESISSGAFRMKVAAARIFNLIRVNDDSVVLTDLGKSIIDRDSARAARVWAFLSVPLYKAVFDMYRGHQLPRDSALESDMEKLGVSPRQTDKARQVFQRSAEQAGMITPTKDRLVVPAGISLDEPPVAPANPTHEAPHIPPSRPAQTRKMDNRDSVGDNAFVRTMLRSLPPIGAYYAQEDFEAWLDSWREVGYPQLWNKEQSAGS